MDLEKFMKNILGCMTLIKYMLSLRNIFWTQHKL